MSLYYELTNVSELTQTIIDNTELGVAYDLKLSTLTFYYYTSMRFNNA